METANKCLILKLDDKIDIKKLIIDLSVLYTDDVLKVRDVARTLDNAILKAKEKK